MSTLSPHDPFDELMAAALHGELPPAERARFDARLQTDAAARAAYQEAQLMHAMLEEDFSHAKPDPAFEQRMVAGVRRKLAREQKGETAWESLLALWLGLRRFFAKRRAWEYAVACVIFALLVGVAYGPLSERFLRGSASPAFALFQAQSDAQKRRQLDFFDSVTAAAQPLIQPLGGMGSSGFDSVTRDKTIKDSKSNSQDQENLKEVIAKQGINYVETAQKGITLSGYVDSDSTNKFARKNQNSFNVDAIKDALKSRRGLSEQNDFNASSGPKVTTSITPPSMTAVPVSAPMAPAAPATDLQVAADSAPAVTTSTTMLPQINYGSPIDQVSDASSLLSDNNINQPVFNTRNTGQRVLLYNGSTVSKGGLMAGIPVAPAAPAAPATPAAVDTRKLVRNAQLDLEVKSFPSAMDQITALTQGAGGYVDTSNSQRGGNGKLQGTVIVKVLPQNLDGFLLKLRDLGRVQNQSVSTDDVTKDYFDTQARLDNSRRMETQLQQLLQHENGKVSDLLQVERELGRVRGEIEQMQGQLKLYDFQVQYATVTLNVRENDLNQAAAYLLKEQDDFSLFATDVEDAFAKARQVADTFKAQTLVANLVHNSGSDVAAELTVMVAPDQIDPFLAQVRSLGRVSNFTRQTQRVAKDGGDSDQPADQTLTEKDKVQVHVSIRSDDETRKQVALTVVSRTVGDALDRATSDALAQEGVEILSSSLNQTPQGASTAQLSARVPGRDYAAVIAAWQALGRTSSLSIQRNDDSGPGANGDDAPVIVTLALTDDDAPLQQTEMSVLAGDVDGRARQIKQDAAAAGVEVKASSFERQPDGTELAQMTFRLPMAKYPAFVDTLGKLGKVESLTVHRDDRPDQAAAGDSAPAEISLQLHNQRDIVGDNSGLMTTLRQTFGAGADALFASVRVIGVILAFLVPWVITLVLLAWAGRRIYVRRKR